MNDSDHAILAELKADAAASQAAWPLVTCDICSLRFVGDFGDLDAHQAQGCDPLAYLDGLYDEDEEDAA